MRLLWTAGLLAAVCAAGPASAQGGSVEGAEAAYDEGVQAFEAGDFEAAGVAFERADELLPARVAMENAIRAYREAGNELRAATVATALAERDAGARRQARFVPQVARNAYQVTFGCNAECTMHVDGEETRYRTVFVTALSAHVFRATFDTGVDEMASTGSAGEERVLVFERPAEPVVDAPIFAPGEPVPEEEDKGISVIPAWATLGMAGVTVALAGVAVWSGIDTNSAKSAYDQDPTLGGYEDGQSRESRTNVLLGVTAGVAVVTAGMAIFTDWSFGVAPMEDGAIASVSGSLP